MIKFCERKIHDARERRMVDRDSYELIWRMLILLLRQKGQVEGSDLAGLLITEKSRYVASFDIEYILVCLFDSRMGTINPSLKNLFRNMVFLFRKKAILGNSHRFNQGIFAKFLMGFEA